MTISISSIAQLPLNAWSKGTWYQRQAVDAIKADRYQIIRGRNDQDMYLLRMWRNKPRPGTDGARFDSGNSDLIHWFPRGDDDACLHDHPWGFHTRILAGGYMEHLPPLAWEPGDKIGPAWDERIVRRNPGDMVMHNASDLHCVGQLLVPATSTRDFGGCWTNVVTGPKERSWGFHPTGKPWVYWRTFLNIPAEPAKQGVTHG